MNPMIRLKLWLKTLMAGGFYLEETQYEPDDKTKFVVENPDGWRVSFGRNPA
jgi:hypothetical protein